MLPKLPTDVRRKRQSKNLWLVHLARHNLATPLAGISVNLDSDISLGKVLDLFSLSRREKIVSRKDVLTRI